MLFSFLKFKKNQSKFMIFAVDTSAVTLTLIEKNGDSSTKILHVNRLSLEMDQVVMANDLLRLINKKIDLLFKGVSDKNKKLFLKHNTQILVLVGSPWHIGWCDKMEINKDESFRLTKNLIDNEVKKSFENTHTDLSIISINITNYKLNGYNLENPFGKITKSVNLGVYISSAPKEFISSIQKTVKSYLPHNKLIFSSYNSAIKQSIATMSKNTDYLIVIPENETTDLILVKNNSIISEASIPFGGAVLARKLFSRNSSSIKEAISKTKRFITGELEMLNIDELGIELEKSKSEFSSNFRDILWKMNDSLLLPQTIYVAGKNIATHFVCKWIEDEEYTNKTFTADGFSVVNIRGNDVCQTNLKRDLKTPFASAVSVLAVNMLK